MAHVHDNARIQLLLRLAIDEQLRLLTIHIVHLDKATHCLRFKTQCIGIQLTLPYAIPARGFV